MIVRITKSPLMHKRFRVVMDNGRHYDFGFWGGNTYLDHHDKIKRMNYWRRHMANDTEYYLVENLIPSASLFSALLLWGKHQSLSENVKELNKLWADKHKGIDSFDINYFLNI
jgi:hypothetical protein